MTLQLSRRFWSLAGLSLALVLVALVTERPALLVAALVLGYTCALGATRPRRSALEAAMSLPAHPPHEGQGFPVRLRISNRGRRAVLAEWRLPLPPLNQVTSGEGVGFLLLRGRDSVDLPMEVQALLFGKHRVGPPLLRIEDPWGLSAQERRLAEAKDLGVYPAAEPLDESLLRARQKRPLIGVYEVPQAGSGFEFQGLRDYSPGDRPRDLNWKASARVGHLVVNQHQKESDAEVVILVDVRSASAVGLLDRSAFARGCRAALAVAEAHLRRRDAVRFVAYGSQVHQARGRQLQGILDLMLGLSPEGSMGLQQVVQDLLPSMRPGSPVLLISCLAGDPSAEPAVASLGSHGFSVRAIVPRAAWGVLGRTQGAKRWDSEQDAAVERLRALGVPVVSMAPDEPLEKAAFHLQVIAR